MAVGGCRRLVHVDLEVRSDVRHHKKAPAFMRRAGNSEACCWAPGPQDPCSPITLKQQVGEILQALQALRAFFELYK